MLLETRLSDETYISIDAEAVASINKGDNAAITSPEKVMSEVLNLTGQIARDLAIAAKGAASTKPTPAGIELEFGIRVDSNSVVSVSRRPDDAQFKVRVRWGR